MNLKTLPFRNIAKKPLRTAALMLLVMFLTASLFGGSVTVDSLRSGMDSLEARLGADVIVVPAKEKSQVELRSMLLQGTLGYFYMNRSYLDELAAIDGVEKLSAQYFLASASAGCCSVSVQIIGFDPETDFTVQPWIKNSIGGELGFLDVVVGADINSYAGGSVRLYGVDLNVVGKLDFTGTGLDTAVYVTADTVKHLIRAASDLGNNILDKQSPDSVISAVYIKVKDGWSAEDVANDINLHVRRVEAVRTKSMFTGISDSLSGISGTVAAMIAVVWVMCVVIMFIAFTMSANERKKEFAIMRAAGMSRSMLAREILSESLIISVIGAAAGILLTCIVIYPFGSVIENALAMPFLMPSVGTSALYALFAFAVSAVVCPLASAYAAFRLSRVDVGTILREGS